MKKNKIFQKILKKVPLKIRLEVISEHDFINLITELGYRENKMWVKEEDAVYNKLYKCAIKHTKDILNAIKRWEKDGSPT